MTSQRRAHRPADLIDWQAVDHRVYDLAPEWRTPRPEVAGLRTPEEVEQLRSYLLAGRPFRRDPLAPRLLTDKGQQIIDRTRIAEDLRDLTRKVLSNGFGIAATIVVPFTMLGLIANLGGIALAIAFVAMVALPVGVKVATDAITAETVHPVAVVVPLRADEQAIVRDVRDAVGRITGSRAYREGYLEQHRSLVDLNATADAIIRRVVELSRVRGRVNTLTGPVRRHADEAMRQVSDSLATQVQALRSYSQHVRRLDQHLSDADSNLAAGEVFEQIRGLLASTVEDELQAPQLADASQLTQATSTAIAATVQEASGDLYRLLGTRTPSLPDLR